MLAVVMDVFDSTWVGIHACLSILLESIVGPAALPQSIAGTRRQFHTAYRDLPVAIPAIDQIPSTRSQYSTRIDHRSNDLKSRTSLPQRMELHMK
ncbi:hypothetical protein CBS147326_1388 [Penicillium roqueforti]|nr:hypothetical protein CBS147326_1388 [Penicillium roqueforti]